MFSFPCHFILLYFHQIILLSLVFSSLFSTFPSCLSYSILFFGCSLLFSSLLSPMHICSVEQLFDRYRDLKATYSTPPPPFFVFRFCDPPILQGGVKLYNFITSWVSPNFVGGTVRSGCYITRVHWGGETRHAAVTFNQYSQPYCCTTPSFLSFMHMCFFLLIPTCILLLSTLYLHLSSLTSPTLFFHHRSQFHQQIEYCTSWRFLCDLVSLPCPSYNKQERAQGWPLIQFTLYLCKTGMSQSEDCLTTQTASEQAVVFVIIRTCCLIFSPIQYMLLKVYDTMIFTWD